MTDSWHTPNWVLEMFPNFFDPCPYDPDWGEDKFDGLEAEWPQRVFINPPYSNPLPWIEKGLSEKLRHNMIGSKSVFVFLLKHDSSTRWYKLLHEAGARFLMIAGRLCYSDSDPAPFPSVMVVL